MSAVLGSFVGAPRKRLVVRPQAESRLPWCVLAVVLALELTAGFFPGALLLHPIQGSVLFKQVSGYTMVVLLVFAMSFGWLRRLPSVSRHSRKLSEIHQLGGMLLLVLLASHLGQSPKGFLQYVFHAMAFGLTAGSLRAVLGPKIGSAGSSVLLALHIGLSCLVGAGAVAHLYFIYAYTS